MKLVNLLVLVACGCGDKASEQATTPSQEGGDEPPPAEEAATAGACDSSRSIAVSTKNETDATGDLCEAFNRVVAAMADPSPLDVGSTFQLNVTLQEVAEDKNETSCKLSISVFENMNVKGMASGAAKVAGVDDLAARDCIDAVLDNLLSTKIAVMLKP